MCRKATGTYNGTDITAVLAVYAKHNNGYIASDYQHLSIMLHITMRGRKTKRGYAYLPGEYLKANSDFES